jgi:CheY-like chemotaxis protein
MESKTEALDLPRRTSVYLEKRQSTKIESEDIAQNPKDVFSSGNLISSFGTESLRTKSEENKEEISISSESKFKIVKMLRILVVDDNENIREMLEDFLNFEGHKPVLAKDGKEALKIFSEQDFDIVITDLGMPGMSGWELTDQIKQRKPEIPVVVITGWGAQLSAGDLKENKVDMILSKPFSLDRVKQMLEMLRAKISKKKM